MSGPDVAAMRIFPTTGRRVPWRAPFHAAGWAFVYVFFSNGTPFDAPNRSETCRPS